jgi:hypothetical protein
MDLLKVSSIISLIVAIAILFASFFQWWNITYNGKMITKVWIKVLFSTGISLLLISFVFILIS